MLILYNVLVILSHVVFFCVVDTDSSNMLIIAAQLSMAQLALACCGGLFHYSRVKMVMLTGKKC